MRSVRFDFGYDIDYENAILVINEIFKFAKSEEKKFVITEILFNDEIGERYVEIRIGEKEVIEIDFRDMEFKMLNTEVKRALKIYKKTIEKVINRE